MLSKPRIGSLAPSSALARCLAAAVALPVFAVACSPGSVRNPAGTGGMSSGSGGSSGGSSGRDSGTDTTSSGPNGCTPLPTIGRRLWRLSAEQWGAAAKDLLGLPAAPVLSERGGESAYAFFSDASKQVDSPMLFNMYQLAQTAVSSIDSSVGTTIAPCTGTTASAQTACAQTFIQGFVAKAYRRPPDSDEVPNLMSVYAQGAMQSYKAGIELMITAVLTAPSFAFRTELGPPATASSNGQYPDTTLTPYEVASQLSFTLTGSLPDAALAAAAANGTLDTAAGIQAQVTRLLGLPAVQANITNIMLGWFNVNQMYAKVHDTALLASLPTAEQNQTDIENDLESSTQSFVSSILWKGSGKIDELLTSQAFYANKRLATLYPGLSFNGPAPTDDNTFVAATWPASQGRAGLLTQPSWFWGQSDPSLMSIVKRGKAIHDNIVCADPLPPPIDLTTPSALNVIECKSPDGTMTLSACNSEEEMSDSRMTFQPCKSCHGQMDPYARALDNFGPIGNYQTATNVETTDAGTLPTGGPIDSTVTFTGDSPLASQTITGAQAFAKALVTSGHFDGCSVQQIASYVLGSQILTYNTCELEPIRAGIDGSVQSLLTNVLLANAMRARAGGSE